MPKNHQSRLIYRFFVLLAVINFILLGLAIVKFAGVFDFMSYPLSYSGHAFTPDGQPNTLSMYIYCTDMIISAAVMLMIASELKRKYSFKNFFTILALTAAAGFFVAGLAPDDIRHPFHVAGSATFVASLWLMATFFLVKFKKMMGNLRFYLLQTILQLTIFTYAFTYFFDLDISNVLQKFAILGLFISIAYSSKFLSVESILETR